MPKSLSVLFGSRILKKKYKEFEEYHEKILAQLQSESFSRGLSFEKLRTSSGPYIPFSFRLNEKIRGIVTKVIIQNNPYWVVLDVMLDHRYNREIFLKPGQLKNMLESDWEFISGQIEGPAQGFEQMEEEPHLIEELTYYNDHYLSLDSCQSSVMTSGCRKLVTGMPGSGKSLVAMSWMLKQLYEFADSQKILYVVQSPRLAANITRIWRNSPEYQAKYETKLCIQHYQEHFKLSEAIIGKEAFYRWFDNKMDVEKVKVFKPKHSYARLNELMYQELRMMTGLTEEEYLNRGQRHTLFDLETPAELLWSVYRDYLHHLQTNHLIDMGFHEYTGETAVYDQVIIDEAQDLTPLQIKNLVAISKNKQVACFMDTHQSLYDSTSKVHFVKKLLEVEPAECHQLSDTKRCPQEVIEFGNQVLNLKYTITGGILEKDGYSHISSESHTKGGQLIWMDRHPESLQQLQEILDGDADTIVVTTEDFRDEARSNFPHNLVLTAEQIKGLEYPRVIAYRLLEQHEFHAVHQFLKGRDTAISSKKVGRAKRGEEHDEFAPVCNQFFITVTRATQTLIVMENKRHPHHYLCDFLRPKQALIEQQCAPKMIQPIASKSVNWEVRIEELIHQGLLDEAWRMAKIHLDFNLRQFKDFCGQLSVTSEGKAEASPRFFKPKANSNRGFKLSSEDKKFLEDGLGPNYNKEWECFVSQQHLVDDSHYLKLLPNQCIIFSWMCEQENFLLELFKRQPLKMLPINREILIAHPKKRYDYSPLFLLSRTKIGIQCLRQIFKVSPHLMHSLTENDLCQSFYYQSFDVKNTSVLYNLCFELEGIHLLNDWIEVNPNIISAEALFRLASANWNNGDSAFNLICSHLPFSQSLIETIHKHRPDVLEQMTYEDLFHGFKCDIPSHLKNSSPMYWLLRSQHETQLLWTLLVNKFHIFSQLKMSDLVSLVTSQPNEETSIFYYFCRQLSVDSMFCAMVQESGLAVDPLIAQAIVQENTLEGEVTYPLFWLTETQYGCENLKCIISHPQNLSKIKFSHLTHMEISVPERKNVLQNLFETNQQDIIQILSESNALLSACIKRYLETQPVSESRTFRIGC